eukprot:9479368-Pyramimonas_sp.AAC.2
MCNYIIGGLWLAPPARELRSVRVHMLAGFTLLQECERRGSDVGIVRVVDCVCGMQHERAYHESPAPSSSSDHTYTHTAGSFLPCAAACSAGLSCMRRSCRNHTMEGPSGRPGRCFWVELVGLFERPRLLAASFTPRPGEEWWLAVRTYAGKHLDFQRLLAACSFAPASLGGVVSLSPSLPTHPTHPRQSRRHCQNPSIHPVKRPESAQEASGVSRVSGRSGLIKPIRLSN